MPHSHPRWIPVVILVLYAALVAFSAAHHEPWRDEGQAWMIARDLPLPGVIGMMGLEGTPALWHLMLYPFAHFGAPFAAEHVLHVLIAIAAVALLLWRAPFPLWFKVLFIFSYYMSYEYAVIARNYNITIVLLFFMAAMYRHRFERPLVYGLAVALLANTNVHSLSMAFAIGVLFLVDLARRGYMPRRGLVAAGVMVLGGLLALLQLRSSTPNALIGEKLNFKVLAPVLALKDAFLPGFPNQVLAVLVILPAVAVVMLWRRSKAALWLLACGLAGPFAVFVTKHGGELRHHGFLLIFFVFALWIANEERQADRDRLWRATLAICGVTFILSLPYAVHAHWYDARGLFSGSRSVASYINEHGLEDRPFFAYESAPTSAILPYLPHTKFWYADIQAKGTFIVFDKQWGDNQKLPPDEVLSRCAHAPGWKPGAMLVLNHPLADPGAAQLTLRYEVTDPLLLNYYENFYLYEYRPDLTQAVSPHPSHPPAATTR